MGLAVTRILGIRTVDLLKVVTCIALVSASSGLFVYLASMAMLASQNVVIRLIVEVIFGATGFGIGLLIIRFVVKLAERVRLVAVLLGR